MSQDDPRLIPFNLLDRIRAAYQDRWPKPGEELILILGSTAPPPAATDVTAPPLRALAMEPGEIRRPEGHDHRPVPRPQSVRRPARSAGAEPLAVRAAIGRRRGVGDGRAAKGQDVQFRSGQAHRHRPLGQGAGHRAHGEGADVARRHEHRAGAGAAKRRPRSRSICRRRRRSRSCSRRRPKARPMCGSTERIRMQLSRDLESGDAEGSHADHLFAAGFEASAARRSRRRSRSRPTTRERTARSKSARPSRSSGSGS